MISREQVERELTVVVEHLAAIGEDATRELARELVTEALSDIQAKLHHLDNIN